MKITKLGHACLLVEMPAPVNRTALFDPGFMSEVDVNSLEFLDDIIITHGHGDHMNPDLIKALQAKFPKVRVKASSKATAALNQAGIQTMQEAVEGVEIFDAPHEPVAPVFPDADNIGVHYLGKLTDPGDSLSFVNSKAILALPVAAPWGSSVDAVNLAIKLKPKYVIPIHDWHWSQEAQKSMYDLMEQVMGKVGITFMKAENGQPMVFDV